MNFSILATSYAPGHNFWPGSPWTWWVRGAIGFLLVAGPQLAMLVAAVVWTRHTRRWMLALLTCTAMYFLWPEIIGLRFRDGDKPWYIGMTWGDQSRTWFLMSAGIGCLVAAAIGPRDPHGFPVSLGSNADTATPRGDSTTP